MELLKNCLRSSLFQELGPEARIYVAGPDFNPVLGEEAVRNESTKVQISKNPNFDLGNCDKKNPKKDDSQIKFFEE